MFAHKSPARVLSKAIPLVGLWVTVKSMKNVFSTLFLPSLLWWCCLFCGHGNVGFSPPRAAHRDPRASVGTLGVWLTLHMAKVSCVSCFCAGPRFSAAPELPKFLQIAGVVGL